jgi:hypothetical protein
MMPDYTPTIISFIGGAVIGWLGHAFTNRRDRAARRRDFLGFLGGWRAEIQRTAGITLRRAMDEKVPAFGAQAAKIRPDVKRQAQFDADVQKLIEFGREGFPNPATLVTLIDNVAALV